MLLPGILFFVIFKYVPMFGALMAFKDYSPIKGFAASPWVGFKHFDNFFSSIYFWQLMRNTLLISIYKLIGGMIPSIILALLLNEVRNRFFKRTVQTITYFPHFLSWVVIYGIMLAFLAPSSGLVNQWIKEFGGEPISFFESKEWFRSLLVFSSVWKDLGWGTILYLAAMTNIDPQLYEAARIDGASRMRQIWHITLPSIRNVIVILLIINLGNIMEAGFQQIIIMYNARVYSVADVIDTYVYREGLLSMNYSYAAAVGLFQSVIGLILVIASNRMAKKWGESGLW
jgi:putative aldouronate transport system permease protein